jgi:oxygen-independent coproporphyrinogen-3 oxidase
MMNRAHNSAEAQKCLEEATKYFDISLDLIYGVPGMSNENGSRILKRRFLLCITHLELCFDGRAQNGHE